MIEKLQKFHDKHRIVLIIIAIIGLLILLVTIVRPFESRYIVFRLLSKVFAGLEVSRLKYPDSRLVDSEIKATSKLTMATYSTYQAADDISIVLDFFEKKLPGFDYVKGSRVISEPTYRNELSAGETGFKSVFQTIDYGMPYLEIYIFPSKTGGTIIQIGQHWHSKGVPAWLIWLCR